MMKSTCYDDEAAIRYRQFTDQIINEVSAILFSVRTLENRFSLISQSVAQTIETLSRHDQDLPALIARRDLRRFLTSLEALKDKVRLNLTLVIQSARAPIRLTLQQLDELSGSENIAVDTQRQARLLECIAVLNRLDHELVNAAIT
ncbi:hypothetical protein [Pseudomonas viridiflava]|uniref:hypothetical protein n=1 Tax=Pseudomonas viridiflava TaxID=33069 RepID=UPI002EACA102|nr:hypothetical protein [Pseudomonas viridiflava]